MNIPDFSGHSFLFKQANPAAAVGRMIKNTKNLSPPTAEQVKFFTQEEFDAARKSQMMQDGTGGIVIDAPLGLLSLVTPKKWGLRDKIDNWIYDKKLKMEDIDTRIGAKASGDNPNSIRGRIFSVPRGREGKGDIIGTVVNEDGTISQITQGATSDRRASIIGPVSNTVKVATPFLASAYLAEKFLGPKPPEAPSQANPYNQNTTSPSQTMYRTAQTSEDVLTKDYENLYTNSEKSDIMEETIWRELDKQASMNKIAMLEQELEKIAAFAEDLRQEKDLLSKIAMEEKTAREKVEKDYSLFKQNSLLKQAESEEFRLRTVARERSKHAVKLAEQFLEKGLIKQASFDQQVDHFMSCDETTLNLYANLAKQASDEEQGLESLAYLSEYNIMDSKGTSERTGRGINKAGQTIGEAARYLLEKQN